MVSQENATQQTHSKIGLIHYSVEVEDSLACYQPSDNSLSTVCLQEVLTSGSTCSSVYFNSIIDLRKIDKTSFFLK